MSGASEALKSKMASAKDLAGVVRSMKALAASSITQYERSVEALADYARTVELGLSVCLRHVTSSGPVTRNSKPRARIAILFGSDQGLVGRFNEVLAEYAAHALRTLPVDTQQVWTIGERVREVAIEAGFVPSANYTVPTTIDGITTLTDQLLIAIQGVLKEGANDEIHVFHNEPSVSGFAPMSKRLMPLDATWQRSLAAIPWPTKGLPQVVGESSAILSAFVREYLFVSLFQASAQSLASENASRLAAMQRAEDNIAQLMEDVTRKYHRLRQESIDEELFEVVDGYEAISRRD